MLPICCVQARRRLEAGDPHVYTHEYGDALLKEDFAADSRKYELDLSRQLDITCPVRIIHGLQDTEINPDQSKQVKYLRRLHFVVPGQEIKLFLFFRQRF